MIEYSKAKFPHQVIIELQPLSFRGYGHLAELLIAAAGLYAVGWQKMLDAFKLALLAVASVVAFRAMRDAWFVCVSAAACIADFPAPEPGRSPREPAGKVGSGGGDAVLLFISSNGTNFTQRDLDRAISRTYPVNAIYFLRCNPMPGPL